MIKLRFSNCARQYEQPDSILRRLVEKATGQRTEVVRSTRRRVDLEFSSTQLTASERIRQEVRRVTSVVDGPNSRATARMSRLNPTPPRRTRAKRNIWFTGENVRPPHGDWDGYLSFDLDPLDGRNAYFPLWWEAIGVVGRPCFDFLGQALDVEACLSPRGVDVSQRNGFVCAFIGNPTPLRLHAVEALRVFGSVDVFGHAMGRPVRNKLEIARNYKFVLCFENDYYPGYVTEKVFDAWGTGAIPIWWGCDPEGYVNNAAIVNLADFSGVHEMSQRVAEISADPETWNQMSSTSILTRHPDVRPALQMITRALEP